jgi:tRNA U38,U39,U40 pseudouridine synthase TruA
MLERDAKIISIFGTKDFSNFSKGHRQNVFTSPRQVLSFEAQAKKDNFED